MHVMDVVVGLCGALQHSCHMVDEIDLDDAGAAIGVNEGTSLRELTCSICLLKADLCDRLCCAVALNAKNAIEHATRMIFHTRVLSSK
jgi:hypothetical protein